MLKAAAVYHQTPGSLDDSSNNPLNKTKSSQVSSQAPVEMKKMDKIPRTPIDPELLAQIH
jgi:hypothetical protein